ncbi:EAL domain-containing protein [Pokkaliibacter sp. MBI-7]|uniref:bifunctional diguanylate cyclase/phosphodiesterase n=1 Tax=Pokkaliibacter sp. MBI-7 TaxID=3040600 RepID=UPI00244CACAF|nr:EAL domain-containing protein [Pokkaliibacter sp. MBI-7]MDH2433767.1 EAL domain-containing protein [Pokkaliibacter sp. MBI-7]
MFASFRSRLIILILLILTLTQVLTAAYTLSAMSHRIQDEGQQHLLVGNRVFDNAIRSNGEQLLKAMRILTADFAFKQTVMMHERETTESVLRNHAGRIGADLVFLMDLDGKVTASNDQQLEVGQPFPISDVIEHARDKGQTIDVLVVNSKVYEVVVVPLQAPQRIAWVGMGFPLNNLLADQISGIANVDISFVGYDDGKQLLMASTLPGDMVREVEQEIDAQRPPINKIFAVANGRYSSLMLPLATAGNEPVFALLHMDGKPLQAEYDQLRNKLLLVFFLTVLVGIGVAWPVSRSVSGPVQELAAYAEAIGRGDSALPPAEGKGELAMLNRTLQQMQDNIRSREQQLTFQSSHDDLTGLLNRAAMVRELGTLLQQPSIASGTLLQLCIRDFKQINNVLGYHNGDRVLQCFAERLSSLPLHTVARIGGDEFMLIAEGEQGEEQICQLLAPLSQSLDIDGTRISLRTAAGVVYFPTQGTNVNVLGRRSDIALNLAKHDNLPLFIYHQGLDESHRRELQLIQDLRPALENGDIFLVYQPKVSLAAGNCQHAEALIRWQHAELGFVPPDEFIRLAEHSGNISLISRWVVRTALAQAGVWWQQGIQMRVAVNLSIHDLSEPAFMRELADTLREHPEAAQYLSFEVTESMVMSDAEQVIRALQQLRDMGFSLAIDDFGTGHSSLAYLKRLPVDELKIDKAFVQNVNNDAKDAMIVSAAIQLGHAMNMKITAEGVETADGVATLKQLGCDVVQGYYFSRPIRAADFEQWLEKPIQVA